MPITFDYGHFTHEGAVEVANRLNTEFKYKLIGNIESH
jgi:hypothetical protein